MEKEIGLCETILDAIEMHSVKTPNATAIVYEGKSISYFELSEKTNQLSNYLQCVGLTQNTVIGVYMNRSIDMIIALIGIMKSGNAYLPLDDANPLERNKYIIESSKIQFMITDSSLMESAENFQLQLLCLDKEWNEKVSVAKCNKKQEVKGTDTAYVLYTSGSTGLPKGVEIAHAGVLNILDHVSKTLKIASKDRFFAVATYTFDISVLDFFTPLISGATLVIGSKDMVFDGAKLIKKLEQDNITVMQATPATWRLLIESGWKGNKGFKILCGGEAWSRELADQLLDKCDSLWNMYGPTETTIWSMMNQIHSGKNRITLGKEIPNTSIYILDDDMKEVPHGEIGELYIGGIGVAKGYYNNSELTNKNFFANPFNKKDSSRIYKTGDLVKYNENNELEYIGRKDFQVKIRGFRIELEEIEALVQKHPNVNQAVAHVYSGVEQEDKRIVLFYTTLKDSMNLENEINEILESNLPPYMVPSAYKEITQFPLSLSGKVDRKALETQYPISSLKVLDAYEEPHTEFEIKLAEIWSELLEIDMIGISDDFLELGGHSLMANRLTTKINEAFGSSLSLIDLLTNTMTIRAQAELIENNLISQISDQDIEELLSQLDGLSEEEKEALLSM